MWARIKRLFRSFIGFFIRSAENPELILRQLMDDMRDKIPEMNNRVAEVVAYKKKIEMQRETLNNSIQTLAPMIEQAVKGGESKKTIAVSLIAEDQSKKKQLAELDATLGVASKNVEQVMTMRAAYEHKIRQQIQDCNQQISRSKMADVQAEMSSLMGSFQVGDESDTLDRVKEQVDEKLARAQARQEVASTSVESQMAEVQDAVAQTEVDTLYNEYQKQFGIVTDDTPTEKTMSSIPPVVEENRSEEVQSA